MDLITTFLNILTLTVKDILPVAALLLFFQFVVLRRPLPNWKRMASGFLLVLIGLTLFLDTDQIVTAAKAAGGTGATIIPARGTGIHEAKTFFGLTLEDQTDVVLFVLEASLVAPVLDSIYQAGRLKEAGTGIAFVIDVEHAIGLESQLERFRQAAKSHDQSA